MKILSDSVATVVLCLNFIRARSPNQGKRQACFYVDVDATLKISDCRTNTILRNLLAFTVRRGLLVTTSDLVLTIMYCIHPSNLDWYVSLWHSIFWPPTLSSFRMSVHLLLSKLYVITMSAFICISCYFRTKIYLRSITVAMYAWSA